MLITERQVAAGPIQTGDVDILEPPEICAWVDPAEADVRIFEDRKL